MSVNWVGIGANLGDAPAAFDVVWQELGQKEQIRLQRRSGIYQSVAIGEHAGGTFSNAVFSFSTTLAPLEVLDLLQSIEAGLGRTREVRWGPRPIDLDLLFIDQQVVSEPRLRVPHQAAWYRRFVLDPLDEVASSLRHPVLKMTIAQIHARVTASHLVVACRDSSLMALATHREVLKARYPHVQFTTMDSAASSASVGIRLFEHEPADPIWRSIPVADLTMTPGDPTRRVIDFLTSVSDEPRRVCDWNS